MITAKPRIEDLELVCLSKVPGVSVTSWQQPHEFSDGSLWKFRFIRREPKSQPDRLQATYVLVDKGNDRRVVDTYNKRARVLPNGPGHVGLSNLGSQQLDQYKLSAGVLFLTELGPGHSGFFNGFAPGYKGFHFQYVKERLPIWNSVAPTDRVSICEGRVFVSELKNWPYNALCFSSTDAAVLARAVWSFVEDSPKQYDLLLNYESSGYRCVPVRRRARKPVSLSVTDPGDYGDFGGMELSGVIVTVKQDSMMKALQKEARAGTLKKRVEMAYREVCVAECI